MSLPYGASVPEANAWRELHDPVRGVAKHLALHVLDEASRAPSLTKVLKDAVDAFDSAVEALSGLQPTADLRPPPADILDLPRGAVEILTLLAVD
eukprot:7613347-Lingulodinium_polyedra.AAC.1